MNLLFEEKKHVYWNPYFGGFMLGIIIILAVYISGRSIGAGEAMKDTVVAGMSTAAPEYSSNSSYLSIQKEANETPMKSWLVYQVLGVFAGAFLSGILNNRVKIRLQRFPKISTKSRIGWLIIGGLLFGLGSQFARGCISSATFSGFIVLSVGGIISMFTVFITALLSAYFFRKLWV